MPRGSSRSDAEIGYRAAMPVPPAISILLPARDAADFLDPCLRSIARQTEPDWECIVIDDGSVDDTPGIVARFARADRRFRWIRNPGSGIVAALEAGVVECRGELVVRMDADDLMARHRLERQRAVLDGDPRVAACGTHVRMFPRAAVRTGSRAYEAWLSSISSAEDVRREAYVECPIAHPTLATRRALLRSDGYRAVPWPEDYDLILRWLGQDRRLVVVPERLLAWRQHGGRTSRCDPRYGLDRFVECKAQYLCASFLASHDRFVLWGYGATGRALRRALARRGRTIASVVEVHPRRIGQRIDGVPVVAPESLGPPSLPLIASVAGLEARALIRRFLTARGYREGTAFVCAA